MRRAAIGRDPMLTARMAVTMTLVLALYLVAFAFPLWLASLGLLQLRWAAAIDGAFLLLLFFEYRALDVAVLRLTRARLVDRDEAPVLYETVERLCALADVPRPRLAVVDTDLPNAFAAGRRIESSTLVVTRGLVRELEPAEVEAVLAHELSHLVNRDSAVMTFAAFPSLTLWQGLSGASWRMWLFGLPFMLAGLVLYAVCTGLMLTISRCREYAADRGAAELTGRPEHLMSALQKIAEGVARIPTADLRDVGRVSAFFTVPTRLPSTHPPLERRLDRLAELARGLGRPLPPSAALAGRGSPLVLGAFAFAVVFAVTLLAGIRLL
jgi:heat shock protein HtpX